MLDLTSNLDVALFFATCKYDKKTDTYDYYHDKGEHEGVLYVFDPSTQNGEIDRIRPTYRSNCQQIPKDG